MNKIVTKEILDIYFKYDEDLSLLHERWARKKDKEAVSSEQANILGQYIDKLEFLKVKNIGKKLRMETQSEVKELEQYIDKEVIDILKERLSIT
ncbi:hypothetical protein [uncultured Aquimarina sp.]|uniref:hypothetical protein n=1 Tax=uncultured Aquimarina sp. TaxID=575652 RepID=UPI002625287C|nr:hypothetical protein [uncultured Aquimarina sp.]